jgi:hypothetical protein
MFTVQTPMMQFIFQELNNRITCGDTKTLARSLLKKSNPA